MNVGLTPMPLTRASRCLSSDRTALNSATEYTEITEKPIKVYRVLRVFSGGVH